MQVGARDGEHVLRRRHAADQVEEQRGRASRSSRAAAEDRAQVVLELARRGALDRPVPGVVHARRELVGEQPAADVEELEREHADVAELVEEPRRVLLGLRLRRVRPPARATCAGSRPRGRSRRAGRSASRRRGRGRRGATARGRRRPAPRASVVRGQSPDVSRPAAVPCRRSRGGASSGAPGSPVTSSSERAVGMPSRRKSCFSSSRSWAASSAAAPGAAPTRRAASTGTFSNS